jgi:TPR repeat protein
MKKLFLFLLLSLSYIGSAYADINDGWVAYQQGDFRAALKEFQVSAEKGDVIAQYAIGWMYDNGEGVSQDDSRAFDWYKKAAEQGYAQAQFNLGWMYANGNGVDKNYQLAADWYVKAAEQGNTQAQQVLNGLYGTGIGLTSDSNVTTTTTIKEETVVNEVDDFLAELNQVELSNNTNTTQVNYNSSNVNQTIQLLQTQNRLDELQEQQKRALDKQTKDFERMLEKQRKDMQRQQLYNNLLNNWTPVYHNKF